MYVHNNNTYCNVYRFLAVEQVVQKYPMQYSFSLAKIAIIWFCLFWVFFYMKPVFVLTGIAHHNTFVSTNSCSAYLLVYLI
jgi:hypothetical protein